MTKCTSWTLSIFRWGTGIYLTPEEENIAGPMSYTAYAALALTNDLFSWEKEYRAHLESNGQVPLVNAVYIVMLSDSLTESAAKTVIRAEIKAHEEHFCGLREQYEANPNRSEPIVRWLELLEHSMAGNFAWSLQTPRYQKIESNPYVKHYKAFGDEVRVITPLVPSPRCFVNGEHTALTNGDGEYMEAGLQESSLSSTLSNQVNGCEIGVATYKAKLIAVISYCCTRTTI